MEGTSTTLFAKTGLEIAFLITIQNSTTAANSNVKAKFSGKQRILRDPVSKMSGTYLIPRKRGFSPGAADSDSTVRERTWLMERTVAATNHGMPSTEQIPIWKISHSHVAF